MNAETNKSPGLKRAEEIMIPLDQYPKVMSSCTLRDAMKEISKAVIQKEGSQSLPRALLIFDSNHQLVGAVRRRDIMRGLEPQFLSNEPMHYRKKLFDVSADPNLAILSYDKLVKGIQEQALRPVSEFMRPCVHFLDAEDNLIKAIYEMVSYSLTLLPVLRDKQLVGVVRSVEVFRELTNLVFDG